MQNIQLKTTIADDGILRVQMPAEVKNTELEVLVVFQPTMTAKSEQKARHQGWPPGFFQRTWGSCEEEPITLDESGVLTELDDELEGMFTHQ